LKKHLIIIIPVVLLVLLLFGIIISKKKGQTVLEKTDMITMPDPFSYINEKISPSLTIADALQRREIDSSTSYRILLELSKIYNLKNTEPSDSFLIRLDSLRVVHELQFFPDAINIYHVTRDSQGVYSSFIEKRVLKKIIKKASGRISATFQQEVFSKTEINRLLINFSQIFQWDIDFFIDPQPGDEYVILYEILTHPDGSFAQYGNIIMAIFRNETSSKTAYYYIDRSGTGRYYNEKGESFSKEFLKSPLNYKRINELGTGITQTTEVTQKVIGFEKDYSIAFGTPVEATAEGEIIHVGWLPGHPAVNGISGDYGKAIKIRHNNGTETLYSHLSSFEQGIRVGSKIQQKQLIGYVGSTGLSSGNNLHYAIIKDEQVIDPATIENTKSYIISESEMPVFKNEIEKIKETFEKTKE